MKNHLNGKSALLTIGLISQLSSGKSTFLNSLFGTLVASVARGRETFNPKMYYARTDECTAKSNEIMLKLLSELRVREKELNEKMRKDKSIEPDINISTERERMRLKSALGIDANIIDFPGLNDAHDSDGKFWKVFEDNVEKCDLIIYLTVAQTMFMQKSELDLFDKIHTLINSKKELGKYIGLFICVNKFDENEDEELLEMFHDQRAILEKYNAPIFKASAHKMMVYNSIMLGANSIFAEQVDTAKSEVNTICQKSFITPKKLANMSIENIDEIQNGDYDGLCASIKNFSKDYHELNRICMRDLIVKSINKIPEYKCYDSLKSFTVKKCEDAKYFERLLKTFKKSGVKAFDEVRSREDIDHKEYKAVDDIDIIKGTKHVCIIIDSYKRAIKINEGGVVFENAKKEFEIIKNEYNDYFYHDIVFNEERKNYIECTFDLYNEYMNLYGESEPEKDEEIYDSLIGKFGVNYCYVKFIINKTETYKQYFLTKKILPICSNARLVEQQNFSFEGYLEDTWFDGNTLWESDSTCEVCTDEEADLKFKIEGNDIVVYYRNGGYIELKRNKLQVPLELVKPTVVWWIYHQTNDISLKKLILISYTRKDELIFQYENNKQKLIDILSVSDKYLYNFMDWLYARETIYHGCKEYMLEMLFYDRDETHGCDNKYVSCFSIIDTL